MRGSYTREQILRLRGNPYVQLISQNKLVITSEFQLELYKGWDQQRSVETLLRLMTEQGFNRADIENGYVQRLHAKFRKEGCPGIIPPQKDASVIRFTPEQYEDMFRSYPEQSVEEAAVKAGFRIDESSVEQIKAIREQLDQYLLLKTSPGQTRRSGAAIPADKLSEFLSHPFIRNVKSGRVYLHEHFYEMAVGIRDLPIDRILDVFLIDHTVLSLRDKQKVYDKLSGTVPNSFSRISVGNTIFDASVLRRRAGALQEMAEKEFDRIGTIVPRLHAEEKKQLCRWIDQQLKDPRCIYTASAILKRIKIGRSNYYQYIGSPEYGNSTVHKQKRDDEAYKLIRIAYDYKGFRKGSRQIYMLIPRLTGKKVGLRRIKEIMRKRGISAGIRKANPNKRAAQRRAENAIKDDLLRRKFRLHRPNEVRVSDVTYLDYGNGRRAYGSALMDPVTSRLITLYISETNDLDLALETLRRGDNHPCKDGGIFHSDQGTLYQTADFQKEVLERGLQQSMSKRGNCWDNATQESFFGHFKDECDYKSCRNLNELKSKVDEYVFYYNNERGLWDRGQMTPVEYEAYLTSLSDEAFQKYLEAEEEKYNDMKRRAAELAKKRYGTLGVRE